MEEKNWKNQIHVVNRYEEISLFRGIVAVFLAMFLVLASISFTGGRVDDVIDIAGWTDKNFHLQNNYLLTGEMKMFCLDEERDFTSFVDISAGCNLTTGMDSSFSFSSGRGGEIRQGENTTLAIQKFDDDEVIIDAAGDSGQLWITGNVSNQNFSINFEKAVVKIKHANLGLEWDKNGFKLFSFGGLVRVDLYEEKFEAGQPEKNFANAFFVPPYYQAEINFSSINHNTAMLYYSKLIKDFGVSVISDADIKGSQWLALNDTTDMDLFFQRRNNLKQYFRLINDYAAAIYRSQFIFSGVNFFTFSELKREEMTLERFDYLISAIAKAVFARNEAELSLSGAGLQNFINSTLNKDFSDQRKKQLMKRTGEWDEALTIAVGDDDLTKIRAILKDYLQDLLPENSIFDEALNELVVVFRLAEIDTDKAKSSLKKINEMLIKELPKLSDPILKENLVILKSLRNLLVSLLNRKLFFFEKTYFSGLVSLNNLIIDLSEGDDSKQEEIQLGIQSYLRIISKIVALLKEGDFTVSPDLGIYLIKEVDLLEPEIISDAAVTAFFAAEKARFVTELEFLADPSFQILRKTKFTDSEYSLALSEFERIQREKIRLNEILGENRGEELEITNFQISPEESQTSAISILRSNGITFEELRVDQNNPRNVNIVGGQYGDLEFDALLDVRTEFIYNLTVNGRKISSAVKISEVASIIKSVEDLISDDNAADKTGDELILDKIGDDSNILNAVLIQIALGRLRDLGYKSSESDLSVVDRDQEVVKIDNLDKSLEISVSLNFALKTNRFLELVIGGESIPGFFDSEELSGLITGKKEQIEENRLKNSEVAESEDNSGT